MEVPFGSGFGFIALTSWTLTNLAEYLVPYCAAAAFAVILPLISFHHARRNGPTEIADTHWACLDIRH